MHPFGTRVLAVALLMLAFWGEVGEAAMVNAFHFSVSGQELSAGSVEVKEYFGRQAALLFDQSATLAMNEYQQIGDIVPSLNKGKDTLSIFTSGFDGALPPSAVIDGSSITVDLSSLYLSRSQGDQFRLWNIGGLATGTIDLDTLDFTLSWNHTFTDRGKDQAVTFFLQGKILGIDPVPVPLVAAGVPFASGLAILLGIWRRRERNG